MRTKKAIYNTITEFILQICTIAYGFIITRLVIENYGSSANGLIASISQLLGQFRLIEMGLGGAIIYALYSPLASMNQEKINSVSSTGKAAYTQVGKYFTVLLLLLSVVYPFLVSVEVLTPLKTTLLILVMGSSTCLVFFFLSKYNVLFVASQRYYIVNASRILYTLINLFLMYAYISNSMSLILVYSSSFIATVVQYVVIRIMFNKYFTYIDFKAIPDSTATEKRFDVMIHQISATIIFNMPVILLTIFATLKEVSVYSVYMMIFSGVNMFLGVFNNSLVAGFGNLFTEGNLAKVKRVYTEYEYFYYVLTTVIYISTVLLLEPFMIIYTEGIKDANYTNAIVGILFVIVGVLNNWKIPQSTMINAAGHFKETRHRAIIEAVLSLSLGLILVHKMGLIGVLIASIIGLIYRAIDIFYIKKMLLIDMKCTLLRLLRLMLFVITSIIVSIYLNDILNVDNYIKWLVYAVVIVIISSVLVAFVNYVFEKKLMISLFKRISGIVKK